jgi:hypothetical protein
MCPKLGYTCCSLFTQQLSWDRWGLHCFDLVAWGLGPDSMAWSSLGGLTKRMLMWPGQERTLSAVVTGWVGRSRSLTAAVLWQTPGKEATLPAYTARPIRFSFPPRGLFVFPLGQHTRPGYWPTRSSLHKRRKLFMP